MEKRIKTLYIITIIAILSFLGMQIYWLYTRYDLSLYEYEVDLGQQISESINKYNEIRRYASKQNIESDNETITVPSFALRQTYSDTEENKMTARIYTYTYSAHKLLGVDPLVKLTDEQMNEAVDKIRQIQEEPSDSVVYVLQQPKMQMRLGRRRRMCIQSGVINLPLRV